MNTPSDDAPVELTLDDLDNEALSLVEQLSSYIAVHVEMLNDDEAVFGNDPTWSREQRGAELAQYEAMECLALITHRQPDALTRDGLLELFTAAFADAASGGDPSDRQSFRKQLPRVRRGGQAHFTGCRGAHHSGAAAPVMTRIVHTAYRYKRPPRRKKPVAIEVPEVVTISLPR